MQLYLATTNPNKIKEIKSFIQDFFKTDSENKTHLIIKSLNDFKDYSPAEETGSSFKENASLKSRHLLNYLKGKNLLKFPLGILAEDSGLEVESLNAVPGIYSARYSGPSGNDKKNNELLLKNLKHQTNRKARYVCSLSFLFVRDENINENFFETYCEGTIALEEKGKGGFGYDPLFVPKGETKTFGELPFSFKQKVSHRRKALEKWLKYMETQSICLL